MPAAGTPHRDGPERNWFFRTQPVPGRSSGERARRRFRGLALAYLIPAAFPGLGGLAAGGAMGGGAGLMIVSLVILVIGAGFMFAGFLWVCLIELAGEGSPVAVMAGGILIGAASGLCLFGDLPHALIAFRSAPLDTAAALLWPTIIGGAMGLVAGLIYASSVYGGGKKKARP